MIDRPISAFLDDLAARTPTPGGGAASALAAACGLALFRMVFRFARRRAEDEVAAALDAADARFGELDGRIRPLAEDDARAFGHVAEAYKLPKDDAAQQATRSAAIQTALTGAMQVPERMLARIADVFAVAVPLRRHVRRNIAADLVNGSELLLAAARGAWCNVKVNASYLGDRASAAAALDRSAVLMQRIHDAHAAIRAHGESLF